ncbi:hypothetical protein [Bacillus massilinigeriensis]|uniref:hypothetical protein n=1 Tax=Bacillus mediterraneensis TaxID=1805474 RepID=UPI0008F90F4B|nr:hypothetical protein [Bacillus mediterraneensis]
MIINKKILFIPILFIGSLIIWIFYSVKQPPNWIGQSDNGKWKTNFTSQWNSPKGYWDGEIYYNDEKDTKVQKVSLIRNGTVIHDWDGNEPITKGESFEYLTTTETLNKEEEYVLEIGWKDTNGIHKEVVTLSPKQRYFVLPSFFM